MMLRMVSDGHPLVPESELAISRILIAWYESNKRELPWRETQDPYCIWISEIILQQTRVAQGLDYYLRFMERFPNVTALAEAAEDEVLKYWQGLGYYSRARNLHTAAKHIMSSFRGRFPTDYKDVISLKGVGEYTAAAIVSFAWNLPYPVVDGNVYRVLSRLFALDTPIDSSSGKKQFSDLARLVMDPKRAAIHNQAIMELGALQCIPQRPDCSTCPLKEHCQAFALDRVQEFPVKKGKVKTRDRFFHYLYIIYKDKTFLNRRSGRDIWTGLYEFPLIETDRPMDFLELQQTEPFRRLLEGAGCLRVTPGLLNVKHVLSHQTLYASFYQIELECLTGALSDYVSIPCVELDRYAVPRLIHIYLEKLNGNL